MDGIGWHVSKVLVAASMISFSSWLCGKKPEWAGLVVAFPLVSMLALAFSHSEYKDPGKSVIFAKSILTAVPLSLLFFIPFVFADKWKISFWGNYGLGMLLLMAGFYVHRYLLRMFL